MIREIRKDILKSAKRVVTRSAVGRFRALIVSNRPKADIEFW